MRKDHPQHCLLAVEEKIREVVMNHIITKLLTVSILAACFPLTGAAQDVRTVDREYKLKAAFLYQFTKYIEFPDNAFSDSSSFRIGILGDDPFGDEILEPLQSKVVEGRRIIVARFEKLDDVNDCQILFVSQSANVDLAQLAARTRDVPILTVGESDDFAARWGIINFVAVGGKVRFELNLAAADRSGIRVNGRFKRVATKVDDAHSS